MSFEEKVKLGPCTLKFGALDIDLTHGGVTLNVVPMLQPLHADQYGQGPLDHRITGWDVKVIVPLTQTDYDSIKGVAVFLEETESGKLKDRPIGTSMRESALELTLHPLEDPSGDSDVVLYKAAPITAMEMSYGYDNQRVYNVEFAAYPKDNADPAEAGNFFEIGGVPGALTKYELEFTVENNAEDPIMGAVVSIAGYAQSKTTGIDGKVVFHLPDGDYVYSVVRDPYDTALDVVEIDGSNKEETVTMVQT